MVSTNCDVTSRKTMRRRAENNGRFAMCKISMGSSPFKIQAFSVAIGKIRLLIKAAFSHTQYINLLTWLSVKYLKINDPNCI